MKLLSILAVALLSFSPTQAELPVQVICGDSRWETKLFADVLARLIDRHESYFVTNDVQRLRAAVMVSAITTGNVTAYGVNMEMRPANCNLGIQLRSNLGSVVTDDLGEAVTENAIMMYRLFEAVLLSDHMVTKMSLMHLGDDGRGSLDKLRTTIENLQKAQAAGRFNR